MEQTSANTRAEKSKGPKFVRWAIMLGIVIVLNLFFVVARSLIIPEPQYQDYCPATQSAATSSPQDPQACDTAGGVWTDLSDPTAPQSASATAASIPQGYCDLTAKCMAQYDAVDQKYRLYSFIMEIAFGIIAIVVGVLPLGSSIVSTGLSYGGVLAFVVASAQYWTEAGNWLRFGISLIALAALIYIGLKRFRD